jgi:6-phosphogluconolactonase
LIADVAQQITRWHYQPDTQRLLMDLSASIGDCARQAINLRGVFSIVLAGGSTPKALYQLLPSLDTDWTRWQIYFGDERCLPMGDTDRNDTMAMQSWLEKVPIPAARIHCIAAEQFHQAAINYSALLEFVDIFDLVLLGVGEDGHTASLFPGDNTGFSHTAADALFVTDSPKPPSQRITLSALRLSRADAVWFLATGEGKREILQRWRSGEELPVAKIMPFAGVDIFTDQLID